MEYMTKKAGGDFSKAKPSTNDGDNSIIDLANNQLMQPGLTAAWDGIFGRLCRRYPPPSSKLGHRARIGFTTIVIIANNDYPKAHPDH